MAAPTTDPSKPPTPATHRFQLELEFVLSLANPAYLQYLGVTMPHLFNPSENTSKMKTTNSSANSKTMKDDNNSDSACFARYLKYLYDYWRTPEYSQYLTHPAATLRNLELLQHDQFRRDVTRPDVAQMLAEGFAGYASYQPSTTEEEGQPNGETAENGEGAPQAIGENGKVAPSPTATAGVQGNIAISGSATARSPA